MTSNVRSRDAALMATRPQTYRPPTPTPHTTPLVDQQVREDLAALEQLAADLRSGAATESGVHVGRGHGWRLDPQAAPTVRIAITTTGPAADIPVRLRLMARAAYRRTPQSA